jgi:hypothetical protein
LTGQDGDASAIAHTQSGSDLIGKNKLDALILDKGNKTVVVLAYVAIDFAHRGKLRAFGLRHIKDIGIAKSKKDAGILLGDVFLGLYIRLALAMMGARMRMPFSPFLTFRPS